MHGNVAAITELQATVEMQGEEAAIMELQTALEALPEGHPDRAEMLTYLGEHFCDRYKRTGYLPDLDTSIMHLEAAVEATPEGYPERGMRLNNLGAHFNRYSKLGHLEDLEAAITHLEAAVEVTPVDHPFFTCTLKNLGSGLSSGYNHSRNLPDLEAAITRFKAGVDATLEDDADQARWLSTLGVHLSNRYDKLGNLEDLQAVVEATPEDHPSRAQILSELGEYFYRRFTQTRSLSDLDASITYSEAAVEATRKDHPDRAKLLYNLGVNLSKRYKRSGNLLDLEAAIAKSEAAIKAIPEDHPSRAELLHNLAAFFHIRYQQTGNLQHLEAAIVHSEAAIKATENSNHPNEYRAAMLHNLGRGLCNRYHRLGNLQDLEDAIMVLKVAVKSIPEGYMKQGQVLNTLAESLSERYGRLGNLEDLEAAIEQSKAAVEATPEDHPDRAQWLDSHALHLSVRYVRLGNLRDLVTAIAQSKAAVEVISEGHPNYTIFLGHHALYLSIRYERLGNLQDLEESISQLKAAAAAEATPLTKYCYGQAQDFNNLALSLRRRYERTGNLSDLEAAITHLKAALEALPEDHPLRARMLSNLGNDLRSRYKRTRNLQDIEDGIAQAKVAVQATPDDNPDRAGYLNTLGVLLQSYHKHTGNLQDLEAALTAHLDSWTMINGPILTRVVAASNAAHILVFSSLAKDFPRAYSLLRDTIYYLIPMATSRSLEREDQQYILKKFTGLVAFAASISLEAGKPPLEALRLLELGRSFTNSQLLDYRSDISDLIEHHPALAKYFNSLRQELDSVIPFAPIVTQPLDMSRLRAQQSIVERRNKVAQDIDKIILQVRQKPGFENFLLPISEAYLLSAAKEGPIVVLNVTTIRSDAILVTKEKVKSITLPRLSHDSMRKYCSTCTCPAHATNDNKAKREVLEWLWKAAVQPVLRELGFYPKLKEAGPLPRIWWIGVGLMAKAPIHAAGRFKNRGVPMTTLHYCLPSYTSTIRALQYSRSRHLECRQNGSMLIVTMPTTPGTSSLNVTSEADEIKHSLQNFSTVDILERPTPKQVLQVLPHYNIAHFACHGVSSENPADSHLLLLKDRTEFELEEAGKLRVNDIAALKLPTARLAYLSACSTADSISRYLIDEVTHIVSSFHIAGFAHVIGTCWPSEDEACKKMAVDFYSNLRRTDNVVESYHAAIMELIKQKPLQPLYWGAFIHFGA